MQSKLEVLEKRESTYSEASFRNSLKNDAAEKKAKKKSEKSESKSSDDDDEDRELTDEEKDAKDYQLQRGMEMVIAMSKMAEHAKSASEPKVDDTDENGDSDKK